MFRASVALRKIKQGKSVTEVAFDSGYESLSGFADSFKSIFGVSPKKSKSINKPVPHLPLGLDIE
jgi:AraC family transcriptional regulator, regulatory protein of adaptative response / methylated-DNA-[protein]-cysteine methyltransferase